MSEIGETLANELSSQGKSLTATIISVVARKSYTSLSDMVRDTAQELLSKYEAGGGEVTLEEMHRTGSTLELIDISTTDLDDFRQRLSDYQVDFAIVKDSKTGEYEVMYKCKDMSLVQKALEKSLVAFKEEKPSLESRLAQAHEKVLQQAERNLSHPNKEVGAR